MIKEKEVKEMYEYLGIDCECCGAQEWEMPRYGVRFSTVDSIKEIKGITVELLIDYFGQFTKDAIVLLGCGDGKAYLVCWLIKISDNSFVGSRRM